jgi:hypothetical protein
MQKINNQLSKSKKNGGKEDSRSVKVAASRQRQRSDGNGNSVSNGGRQWLQ